MTALALIRAAIVAKLETVPGIGRVHGYERFADRKSELADLYVAGGQLLGWNVRRIATAETSPAIGRTVVTHRWRIRGFMALADEAASEIAFDTLIEAIGDAFRDDDTLGGTVATCIVEEGSAPQAGIQVEDSGPVDFAGVLCHAAQLSLATRHFL